MSSISSQKWGEFEGDEIRLWTLTNDNGIEAKITNYGGRLVTLTMPDKNGVRDNVTLGWPTLEEYVAENGGTYYGALVGRTGNRIANGKFTLCGKEYTLWCNNTPGGIPCALHGGARGFALRAWECIGEVTDANGAALKLRITSPDGEDGYPGAIVCEVTMTLTNANILRIEWKVTSDATTVFAPTFHGYWNMDGVSAKTCGLDNVLELNATRYTPYNKGMIPTGELRDVSGTPFDFRVAHAIRRDHDAADECLQYGAGYDINWEINRGGQEGLCFAAALSSPTTGRRVELWTTEPGVQIYDGYYLPVRNAGIAIEPQHFPDSPNHPEFPSVVLEPGQTLNTVSEFRFSIN